MKPDSRGPFGDSGIRVRLWEWISRCPHCGCIRVETLARAQVEVGQVVGSTPSGMNVKLRSGTQLCDVPDGLYRVLSVDEEGFTIIPHKTKHLGFRGWMPDPWRVR